MEVTDLVALLAIIATAFLTGRYYERLRCNPDGRNSLDYESFDDDPDLW